MVEMAALTLTSNHKGEPYPIFIICDIKCQQINLFEICVLEPNAISNETWGVDPFAPDPGDGDDALISPSPGGGSCLGKISCGISLYSVDVCFMTVSLPDLPVYPFCNLSSLLSLQIWCFVVNPT